MALTGIAIGGWIAAFLWNRPGDALRNLKSA